MPILIARILSILGRPLLLLPVAVLLLVAGGMDGTGHAWPIAIAMAALAAVVMGRPAGG